ncbi:PrsW family intramembrane metalloprotease [Arcanobacterium haemolyticum]|nr:PrsW family intramembrane metalloprotease [Arcanobacterium haemolyticum]
MNEDYTHGALGDHARTMHDSGSSPYMGDLHGNQAALSGGYEGAGGRVAPARISYKAPVWREASIQNIATYWAFIVVALIAMAAFIYMLPYISVSGPQVALMAAFLAFLPVIAIVELIRWIDQWEPEPGAMYFLAFAWGAGVAALTALFGNNFVSSTLSALAYGDAYEQMAIETVIGAPLIEEATKGAGLLIIIALFRKFFNGPIDGIVYGMLIGVGFAFTENILYFSMYFDEIAAVFQARAIENPFVHPLATAMTGMFLGFALEKRTKAAALPLVVAGYALASLLHALHNYSAVQGMSSTARFMYQIPIYIAALAVIRYLRARERRDVLGGLYDYLEAGWLTRNEYAMIQTMHNRQTAQTWAGNNLARIGGNADTGKRAMKRFQDELVQLGYSRSHALRDGTVNSEKNRRSEANRLQLLVYLREVFTGQRPA